MVRLLFKALQLSDSQHMESLSNKNSARPRLVLLVSVHQTASLSVSNLDKKKCSNKSKEFSSPTHDMTPMVEGDGEM